MNQGKLIVIDGTDGSGKATQTALLVERLRQEGHQVETISFPRHGMLSAKLVDLYLEGFFGRPVDVNPQFASAFYAQDRAEAAPQIREWLESGAIVIADRYVSANQGHQASKLRHWDTRDYFLNWLEELEYKKFGIPRPDLTVLLYVPPEVSLGLIERRSIIESRKLDGHEADSEHIREAAEAFRYVAEKYRWPIIECAPQGQLLSREEIHQLLWDQVKQVL